jgi:guanylate kinase
MGKIFYIMGKSSSGKDTIYKMLIENERLDLKRIVPYTTRPIRLGERDGVEYHFTDINGMEKLQNENKIIESRSYNTVYGVWHYFTAKDEQIDLTHNDYLIIGTLQSYVNTRDYFGEDKVIPIYIDLDDGERLSRAIERERKQSQPKYEELCRRYLADAADFSEDNLKNAGITRCFENNDLNNCFDEICKYIMSFNDNLK